MLQMWIINVLNTLPLLKFSKYRRYKVTANTFYNNILPIFAKLVQTTYF